MKESKFQLKRMLYSKTFLIIVAIISVLNLIGYLMYGMNHLVFIYILIAIMSYYFSAKNMVITFGVPLIVVNILVLLNSKYGIMAGLEGMENAGLDVSMNEIKSKLSSKASQYKNQIMNIDKTSRNHPIGNSISGGDLHAIDDTTPTTTTDDPEPHTEESFEGSTKKGRYRVDYASTIEDAYNELNNVLGSDGIKNLTSDTHNLMKKQLELAETMKSMGPLVQGMAPLLKQVQGLMSMGPSLTSAAK